MDELDALCAFRANTPEPDAASRAAALEILQRHMTRDNGEITRRRFRVVRVVAPVSLAAVVLLVLALASPILGLREEQTSAAARELHALAGVAARQGDASVLAAGEYVYTRSENLQLNTSFHASDGTSSSTLVRNTREIWIGTDGSGRIHEVGQGLPTGNEWDEQFGPGKLALPLDMYGFSADSLNKLSQHPDQLAQAIHDRAGGTGNPVEVESFVMVGDLLRESNAPAELRAALFQVAAGIPGVELLGDVHDPAGRPGVSVAMTHNGVRSELIFDRQTSMLLAERQTIVAPVPDLDFPVGTVIGSSAYLASGVVSSTTATP